MYGIETERRSIYRDINDLKELLNVDYDADIEERERLGYRPDDDTHFILSADIEISDQFYSWICGFHKKAKIIGPPEVIKDFQKFLSDISERYDEKQPEG